MVDNHIMRTGERRELKTSIQGYVPKFTKKGKQSLLAQRIQSYYLLENGPSPAFDGLTEYLSGSHTYQRKVRKMEEFLKENNLSESEKKHYNFMLSELQEGMQRRLKDGKTVHFRHDVEDRINSLKSKLYAERDQPVRIEPTGFYSNEQFTPELKISDRPRRNTLEAIKIKLPKVPKPINAGSLAMWRRYERTAMGARVQRKSRGSLGNKIAGFAAGLLAAAGLTLIGFWNYENNTHYDPQPQNLTLEQQFLYNDKENYLTVSK